MKRSTKKALGLALSGVVSSGYFLSSASANTFTWGTTGVGNSQDWFNPSNWQSTSGNGVPGQNDIALFKSFNPPSGTVNLTASGSVGAIFDDLSSASSTLTIAGSNTLSVYGKTLTVPQSGVNLPNVANVILAMGSGSVQNNFLTISDNLALENTQNVIVAGANNGFGATGQTINLNGNITNGTSSPSQLTFLGGGTTSVYGASVFLNGNNATPNYFSGGMVLGSSTVVGTQGVDVYVTPSSIPTSGTILVNEQSQLVLNGVGTYGAGTTLDLNGGGIGPGVSTGSSGALRTSGSGAFTYAGNVNIGTGITDSAALGFVVISATKGNTVTFSGSVSGSGNIQKQGGGALILSGTGNTWQGNLQMGNGQVIAQSNSAIGTGSVAFAQTSTNNPVVALMNPSQSITNLSSSWALTAGTDTQTMELYGTALTINEQANAPVKVFGYGAVSTLTSTIADGSASTHGSVTYNGASGAQLSFTDNNTYSGGTTVTGGILNLANGAGGSALGPAPTVSAPLSGGVVVNGGILSSGGGIPEFQNVSNSPIVTTGSIAGALTVNRGGTVSPGGAPGSGITGVLDVASVTANAGSAFDFTLAGGTSATASELVSTGAVTLDGSGTETVNVLGDQLALGQYTLMTYSNLAGTGTQFTLGTTPNGKNRSYSLTTNGNDLLLTIASTGTERYWSTNGNTPPTDGGGTWQNGTTSFYNSVAPPGTSQASAPYDSNAAADVIFGSGGSGGTVTITGPVSVGGALIFGTTTAGLPYTIASSGSGNTLTVLGGIAGSANASITAPVILNGAQTFSAASGTTLSITGGISEASAGTTLTTSDLGTVALGGTNTYTGGTVISNGTLLTSTSSLPTSGGVQISGSAASLVFGQPSTVAYSGLISGSGSVAVNTTGTVSLSNASNSYSGATNIEAGVLSISNAGVLGTGAGGINFSGGTLQFTAPMTFTQAGPTYQVNLVSGTSYIDTDGNDVTMDQSVIGAGNLTKIGGGNLTLDGLQPTTVIGQLGVTGGSLTIGSGVSYGFSAAAAGGTFTGDLILANSSLEARLEGGTFSGGGNIRIPASGLSIVTEANTTISNPIVLNENSESNFIVNIGVKAGNTLTITSNISGASDVDFTGGAGITMLTGQSTYTGATTIDNGAAGEVQLDGASGDLPSTTDVHLTPNATLDLYGNVSQVIGSLDSAGGLGDVTNTAVNAIVTNNSPTPGTLATLTIDGNATTNFAGYITDSVNTPTPGGALAIELGSNYTGTLVLNSSSYNSYSGGTILNGGTLLLGSSGDALLGSSTAQGDAVVSSVTFGGGTLELSTAWVTSRPLTINPGVSTISEQTPGQSVNISAPSINWNGGTLALTNTGASTITQNGGSISVTSGSTLSVGAGLNLAVNGTTDPFTDGTNSSKHVAIVNNGAFSLVGGLNSSIAGITGSGTLIVGDGTSASTLQLATGSGASSQASLSILANSTLDITNNHLFINYGSGSDPIASIAALIKSGYAGGTWTGTGITSSAAAANSASYGIGYADSADNNNPAGLPAGTIEIKYTLLGDANLDGAVNSIDFAILASNFNKAVVGPSGWDQGDFNYDKSINSIDFASLAGNFNKGASQADLTALEAFASANGLLADVPEPASMGLLTMGAVSLLARRRRRAR